MLIDDADSVLIVVDAQPGFLGKLDASLAAEIVDRIRWLVTLATHLDVPVVVTEEEPDRNGDTADPIVDALPAGVSRHLKEVFGLAACLPILADVERHGRSTAVLCGLETDVCVAQSAIGLHDRGWRVAVVSDAVGAPGSAQEQGLSRMRDRGVEVVGTKGLAYEWIRTVVRADDLDRDVFAHPPAGITL